MRLFVRLFVIQASFTAILGLIHETAFASAGLTLQGRILKPTGAPVDGSNVQFRVQVRSGGSEDCLLFQETHAIDMRSSNGLFSLTIGSGTRASALVDGGYSIDRIFANRGTLDFSTTSPSACAIGTTFSPSVAQNRRLVYFFNDGSGWETVPSMAVNWVPLSLESLQVGGYRSNQLLRVTDASGNPQTAPNLTPAQAVELLNLITGATVQYVKPGSATFTAAPQYAGTVSGANDLTNKSYVDTAVASAVATGLPDVGTAGTYTKVTTDAKGRVTAGATLAEADIPTLSTAGKVSGAAINTGTIGGNAAINTSGNIVTSGTVSSNIVSGNSLRLYDGATNYVSLAAPTLTGIISFKLPSGDGSAGQVLKTDGSGNLGWVSVTSGTVTSVTSGGAPITVGGTAAAPTVSITQSGASSDGYLSSTDWNTFNNKLGTASAFSGDVTGTSSTTSVDKIKSKVVAPVAYSAGQVLRYDGTNWVNTALPFADLASKPTTLAGYGITDAASSTLADGKILVGNGSNAATAVFMSGDATLSNAGVLTLNTVPTSKGGTGSTSFTANQLVGTNGTGTALVSFSCTTGQILAFGASGVAGCENVNGAGLVTRLDSSANLNLASSVIITGSAAPAVSAAGKGQIYFDSTANKFKISQNGGAYVDLVSGTVTAVTANAPLSVTSGSTTPDLSISQANTTTDGYLSSTDWNTFNNKQSATLNSAQVWVGNGSNVATARTASGDVSLDNAGVFAVNKIKGYPLDFTAAPTSGEILKYNGTSWVATSDSGLTVETDPNVQAWGKAAPNSTNFDTTGNVLNLKDTAVTAGSYGGASSVATFTVDAKGRLTAAGSVTVDDTTKLPLGGGTMTGAIAMGGNNITNVGNLELAASKYLGVGQYAADPATGTWGNPEKGRTWFNTTSNELKYWDGAAVRVLGVAGSGITSFNGSTQGTQTLETPGTSGTAPNWSTNAGTGAHTLNIPMASTAAVTAGLISKTKYDEFDAKLGTASTFSGDVSGTASTISVEKIRGKNISPTTYAAGQTLRYNGTQWINATLDFADLSNKPTTLAGYGITDAASTTLADGKILVGNASNAATAVTMSGDATLSNAGVLTLNTVQVSKGGTGSTSFTANQLVGTNGTGTALTSFSCTTGQILAFGASGVAGCENVNGAGLVTRLDSSANLNLASSVVITGSAAPAVSAAGKGQIYFDSTANKFKISQNGGAYVDLVSGTVTAVSANAPLSVTNGSTTPDLSISQATTTTDGYLSSTDWNTFNNKQTATLSSANIWVGNGSNVATARVASGDVSIDNTGVFAVNKIKGYPLDFTAAPTSGEVLKYNGTRWVASTDNGITSETDPNVQAWAKAAPNSTNFDTTGNVINLKDTAVTAGSYGGASSVATFTVDAKGRLTAAGSVTVDDTTKLPLAGGTMTGAIAMGGQNITNAGNIEMAASKHFGLSQHAADPATGSWGAAEKGRTWFNTTSNELKYWDGAAIRVLGVAGSGITSFNGSSQGSQTLETPGTSGTAPNWSTNAGTGAHTLNIPMASTAAVTAGLLSKTKYDEFDAKLGTASTFSGDVSGTASAISVEKIRGKNISPAAYASGQTLRYNGTQWINAVLDFADLGNKPTTLAGYGITDAASTTLADGKILVGNGSNVATAVTMSGDATLSNAGVLTLNTVPTSKGGTGSTTFTANQLVGTNGTGTALTSFSCTTGQILAFGASGVAGCENVNGAGLVTRLDSSANLNLASSVVITGSAAPAVSAAGKGQIYFDSTANKFKISQNGGAYTDLVSGGTVTTVTANAPLSVTSGSTTPDLSIAQANTTTSGYITSTDWNTFNNKQSTTLNSAQIWVGNGSNVATARTASGDVALDNAGVFAVNKIKGYPLDFTAAPTSGEILKYNGTSWAPAADTGGIASLNGSTQTTQTLETPGTSGTAPNWSTNAGTGAHTLNIPLASTASVTAGLLSKTKYDEFDAKLGTASTFSGDVSGTASTISVEKIRGKNISPAAYAAGQTLRYNGTQWVNATLDFADLSNKPTTLAGYGITDASSSTLADGKIFVGNGSNVATAVSLSGDATIANTGVLTLNTVPVAKGGTGRTSFGNGRVLTTHSTTGAIQDTTCAQYQVISFDASGNWYCANVNSLSATFVNGGNSFGAAATLGTNDAYGLDFETSGTTRMSIDTSGNVGIGATSPAEKLSIGYGVNNDVGIGTATSNKLFIGAFNDSGVIALNRRVGDGVFANTSKTEARIALLGDNADSRIVFSTTATNNALATERMRIAKDGNVGIGVTNPTYKLHLGGENTQYPVAFRIDESTHATSRRSAMTFGAWEFGQDPNGDGIKNFYLYDLAASKNRWTVTTSGYMGIGTTSPNSILDVSGAVTVRGLAAPAVSPAGQGVIYFDSTANKFKVSQNGGAYTDLVNSSSGGITSFNGSTQATQTLETPGTSGTAPNWSTNAGTGAHTLNIPLASTASVTAGLLSKTDYDAFNAKMSTTLADGKIYVGNGSNVATAVTLGGDATLSNAGSLTLNTVTVGKGGTGATSLTSNGVLLGNGTSAVSATAAGSAYQSLRVPSGGGAPAFGAIDLSQSAAVTGTLAVANGGTGLSSLSNGRVLTTSGAGALQATTCSQYQVISFDASGNWYCANVNALSGSFIQDGNSFAAAATLGTNDANSLTLETNNTARMTILSDGKIGVGVTSPGALFDINGTSQALSSTNGILAVASNDAYAINKGGTISLGGKVDATNLKTFGMIGAFKENSTSANEAGYMAFATRTNGSLPAERMRIDSTGKIGVGTTSPWATLDVQKSDAGAVIRVLNHTSTTAQYPTLMAQNHMGTVNLGYPKFEFQNNRGNSSVPAALVNGDYLGQIAFTGGADASWNVVTGASITAVAAETFSLSDVGTDLFFSTGKIDDATPTERMRIKESGYVGIGTASPRASLDVSGAIVGKAALSSTGTSIDFASNNLAYTTANCGAFTLNNMKDGGSYTLAVQGTSAATACSFTAYSGSGTTGLLTVKMPPDHDFPTSGKQTVYTFLVLGTTVYTSWVPGF